MLNNLEPLVLKVIRVKQPLGEFYIASIPYDKLLQISYVDRRELASGKKSHYDEYTGIQRQLDQKRTDKISKYVTTIDSSFPTSIVLSVDEKCTSFNEDSLELTLTPYKSEKGLPGDEDISMDKIAKILDGQHRLAGLERAAKGRPTLFFELNVSIFIGTSAEEEAYIFSTINLAQTKVVKSLVYDLAGLATHSSPQKSCHEIAVALDRAEGSPFHQKIKRLGIATPLRQGETITQSTFVEALLPYISTDPVQDRDILLRGRELPIETIS